MFYRLKRESLLFVVSDSLIRPFEDSVDHPEKGDCNICKRYLQCEQFSLRISSQCVTMATIAFLAADERNEFGLQRGLREPRVPPIAERVAP
jgi:hypothetical protein